ncbi:MAG: hemin uptake protein HemP [Ramlibacter sp.]|nr:hemin uptake protein HemP [Ramlibacter sp.]
MEDPRTAHTGSAVAPPRTPPPMSAPAGVRILPSSALLQGGKAVDIEHNGAVYRLQATRLGKLILTK